MLIYISCPYSAPTVEEREANVHKAIDAGIELIQKGHTPLIPILLHYLDLRAIEKGIEFSWDDYMRIDLELLSKCDAMLLLGHSKGCDIELEYAEQLGMPIYYSV